MNRHGKLGILAAIVVLVAGSSNAALAQAAGPADTSIFAGLAISDLTAWFGWLATILLTFNLALGVLQPLRYDPVVRWPHRRLPASIFKLHKWRLAH